MKIDVSSALIQAAENFSASYKVAISNGDLENAMTNVQKCIYIFRKLADRYPHHPLSFQIKAKEWKKIESSLKEQMLNKTISSNPLKVEEDKNIIPDNDEIKVDKITKKALIIIPNPSSKKKSPKLVGVLVKR